MTQLTIIAGLDMIGGFAGGSRAIMATGTPACNVVVVKRGRGPRTTAVAGATGLIGYHVVNRFSHCRHLIVTALTSSQHLGMVSQKDIIPHRFDMTAFTVLGRENMIQRFGRCIDGIV